MAGMAMTLTAVYMKVQEGYVAFIEELPGANTQGETLDEGRENLNEAVALVLEANRVLVEQSLEGATVIREAFALPRHEARRPDPASGTPWLRIPSQGK